ncbi:MAG: SRPBCC domain-containing protein [Spirochaetota bacterium]
MVRLRFSILINAARERVWNAMIDDAGYREWTEPFMAGSHFVGTWDEGSKILFLAPGENGEAGMVSRIRTNRPYEFISIEHLGMVDGGIEDTTSEAVKGWAGALEEYTLRDVAGATEVLIETDSNEEYREMFEATWPKALEKLKELAEKHDGIASEKKPKSKPRLVSRKGKAGKNRAGSAGR